MTTESWNAQGIMISIQGNPLCSRCPDVNRLGLVCRLIELENQVQLLMEAHLAPTQPNQVNKVTASFEICNGSHDTQYCMKDPEQAFVEYASSRTDEARGKWYTFKPEKNNLGDTYNPSWRSHPNLRMLGLFQVEAISTIASEHDNKIDTVLKAITGRIAGALPSDTVKNPKLSTSLVLSARSYPNIDPQFSNHVQGLINAVTIHFEKQNDSYDEKAKENEEEEKDSP
ncbi:hypothetical protein Tco_1125179 [Tanacetum coccineum]|uniref:MAK10-like protein n=1 Tax=Tanacetum coccineum TaxID=301880 RepID=A0ABQ5J8S2_9ASTR